jgi:hypothetical protein
MSTICYKPLPSYCRVALDRLLVALICDNENRQQFARSIISDLECRMHTGDIHISYNRLRDDIRQLYDNAIEAMNIRPRSRNQSRNILINNLKWVMIQYNSTLALMNDDD